MCARSRASPKCITRFATVVGSRQGGSNLVTFAGIGLACMAKQSRRSNVLSWLKMKRDDGTKYASAAWAVPRGRRQFAGGAQCQGARARWTQSNRQWAVQTQATLEGLILIVIGTLQTWSGGHAPRAICLVIHVAPDCALT